MSVHRPKSETGKLLFAGLFDTLNAQRASVMNGLERVTRKQREAGGEDSRRYAGAAGATGRDAAGPGKGQRLGNRLVADPHLRRPAAGHQIRLRGPTAIDQRLFALGRVMSSGWNSVYSRQRLRFLPGGRRAATVRAVGIPRYVAIAVCQRALCRVP